MGAQWQDANSLDMSSFEAAFTLASYVRANADSAAQAESTDVDDDGPLLLCW